MTRLRYILLLVLLLPLPLCAQTGSLTGVALDSLGNTVAGATITVCVQGSPGIPCAPVTASTISNGQGAFSVTVPLGTYTVTVFRLGVVATSSTVVVAPSNITVANNVTYTGAVSFSNVTSLIVGGPSPWFDVTAPPYNAKCDGVTDDTTAINAALTAANAIVNGSHAGTVYLPATKICSAIGPIVMDQMNGVTLSGGPAGGELGWFNGAQGRPLLLLTGTTSPLIGARSSVSTSISNLNIQYNNAAFTGEVIGTEHTGTGCGGGGCDTNGFIIINSSVAGTAGTAVGAICGLCLDKTVDSFSIRTEYDYMVNAIRGQSALSTYSVNNRIDGNQFSINSSGVGTISGTEILNPGANWKILNNDFEFGLAASQPVSTPTGIDFSNGNCQGCSIDTNFMGDMPAGWTGTVFKNVLGPGLSVTNNQAVAGTSNLGTFATLSNGATGINFTGNVIQNYATAFNLTSAAVRDLNIQGNQYANVTTWMAGGSSLLGGMTVDPTFGNGFSNITLGNAPNNRLLLITQSGPSIAANGCGGVAASIVRNNGTAFFTINVGTTPTSACTITMPSASVGWSCTANDITTQSTAVFVQKQTGADNPTSITITNFNDVAVATAFVASDIVKVTCMAY